MEAGSQSLSSLQSSSPSIKAGCTVLGETQLPFTLKPCKSRLYWQKGFPDFGGAGDGNKAAGVGSGATWGSNFLYGDQQARDRGCKGAQHTHSELPGAGGCQANPQNKNPKIEQDTEKLKTIPALSPEV